MLIQIFSFYLQGLVMATLLVILLAVLWIVYRAGRGLDKSVKERKAVLYDTLIMGLISIPILSFACMALLLTIKA